MPKPLHSWLFLLLGGLLPFLGPTSPSAASSDGRFVGSARCATCHPREFAAWRGSDHDEAMRPASETGAILGDFSDVTLDFGGIRARFFRRSGGYWAELVELDGSRREVEVMYAFGTRPLQQYLVAGEGGRLQALTLAWDTRARSEGGQRWFSLLHDAENPPDGPLHWSGAAFRWNRMCADCHSTGLRRGYQPATATYQTAFAEVDVSCESCHAAGGAHAAWAEAGASGDDPALSTRLAGRGRWTHEVGATSATRESASTTGTVPELEVCAPCHARRSQIADPIASHGRFLDAHRPEFLEEGLYFPDGQIQDEVYVYGSFLQSRMFQAGVSCSDCHDPHSLALRAEGNQLCGGCHAPSHFDTSEHHFHDEDSEGAQCVGCHMPARTYMAVDPRRDHGFRVPRPDLAAEIGVPLACLDCHPDRDAAWAAKVLGSRNSRDRLPHFPRIFATARRGVPGIGPDLVRIARSADEPALARATAISMLAAYPGRLSTRTVEEAAAAPDPLVRLAAASALESLPPGNRLATGIVLAADPVRTVRIEAARALADVPADVLTPEQVEVLGSSLAEYQRAQEWNADWPEAHVNLGLLNLRRGDLPAAVAEYREALRVGPEFLPTYVNLADALRQLGDESQAEEVLRRGLVREPNSADLRHALGLSLVRQKERAEALEELRKAAELAPGNSRYAYVFAVALNSGGDRVGALEVMRTGLIRHPDDAALLELGVSLHLEQGEREAAQAYAARLALRYPEDPRWQQVLNLSTSSGAASTPGVRRDGGAVVAPIR